MHYCTKGLHVALPRAGNYMICTVVYKFTSLVLEFLKVWLTTLKNRRFLIPSVKNRKVGYISAQVAGRVWYVHTSCQSSCLFFLTLTVTLAPKHDLFAAKKKKRRFLNPKFLGLFGASIYLIVVQYRTPIEKTTNKKASRLVIYGRIRNLAVATVLKLV